jgi:hypothetical protein
MHKLLFELTLPEAPSINDMYMTRGKYRVLTTEARAFKLLTEALVIKQLGQVPILPLRGIEFYIEIDFYVVQTHISDWDSGIKATQDAVFKAMSALGQTNDAWVVEGHARKIKATEKKTVVRLYQVAPKEPMVNLQLTRYQISLLKQALSFLPNYQEEKEAIDSLREELELR